MENFFMYKIVGKSAKLGNLPAYRSDTIHWGQPSWLMLISI